MKKAELFFMISKKQWHYLSLGFILSTLTIIASVGLLSVAGWLICGAAIAGVVGTAAMFNYMLPATAVRFFSLLRITSRYADRVLTHEATFRMLRDIRVWFYQVLEPLAPAYLIKYRNAELLNRMTKDIDALDKVYLRLLIPFFSSVLLVLLVGIFICFFSLRLSLYISLFLLTGIILIPWLAFLLGNSPGRLALQKIAAVRTKFIEFSNHLMDLILYGKVSEQVKQLMVEQDALIQQQKTQASIRGLINALISTLTSVSLLVVIVVCLPLVINQQLTGANLGLLSLMIFAVFEAINLLPQACQYIGETAMAADRVCEMTNMTPQVQFPVLANAPTHFDLKFNGIHFQYNKDSQLIFKNYYLDIPYGNHLAIVGTTGAGKSTLAYLAVRCFDPTAGEILLGDRSLKSYTESQLRDAICYISQNSHIFHNSIRENLLLAKPNATDEELFAALASVDLKQAILQLPAQLSTLMGEFGQQFSGGQVRRLALARAILKSAPITILDEPLEGVDDATAVIIFQNLQKHFLGKTLIVITHQLSHTPEGLKKFQI